MATGTLGTNANNSLTSLIMSAADAAADVAAIAQAIKDDVNVAHPIWPGAFSLNGNLFIPNRGVLKILPGDYVGVDSTGWPILVSAHAIAAGPWTHA